MNGLRMKDMEWIMNDKQAGSKFQELYERSSAGLYDNMEVRKSNQTVVKVLFRNSFNDGSWWKNRELYLINNSSWLKFASNYWKHAKNSKNTR